MTYHVRFLLGLTSTERIVEAYPVIFRTRSGRDGVVRSSPSHFEGSRRIKKDQLDDHASRSTRPWRRLHPTNRPFQRSTSVGHSPVLADGSTGPFGLQTNRSPLQCWPDCMVAHRPSGDRPYPDSYRSSIAPCRSRGLRTPAATSPTPAHRHLKPDRPEVPRIDTRPDRRRPLERSGDPRTMPRD